MDNEMASIRLKRLREGAGLSHDTLSEKLTENGTHINRVSLIDYEAAARGKYMAKANAVSGMSVKNLCAFADLYGVSTDYILGRNDIESPDPKLKEVCEYTGLSEAAVNAIIKLRPLFPEEYESDDEIRLSAIDALNRLLESNHLVHLMGAIEGCYKAGYYPSQNGEQLSTLKAKRGTEDSLTRAAECFFNADVQDVEDLATYKVQKAATYIAEDIIAGAVKEAGGNE